MQKVLDQVQVFWSAFLDVIAPARCMGCLREGTWLCQKCWEHEVSMASLFPQRCLVCSKERTRGMTCLICKQQSDLFGTLSAGSYRSLLLRRGILWLKFRGITQAAEPLSRLMVPHLLSIASLAQLQKEGVLVPIPLHRSRLKERGFNQSEELASRLSALTGIPMRADVLVRHRSTRPQSHLPHTLRGKNIEEAFSLRSQIPSARFVIFIDDVVTTGSTLDQAASLIEKHRHPRTQLWALTAARG